MEKTFIRWYLFTAVYLCGLVPMWYYGMFQKIHAADVTNITILIYVIFVVAILLMGCTSYRISKGKGKSLNLKYLDITWFLSEAMMTLGLIGTLAGMIYLFGQIFMEIDVTNPDDLKKALSHMATGLSTAMYTTIVGMISALLTRVQLMNLEYGQE